MINTATLIGRVGFKNEKPLKNGSMLIELKLATNKQWKDLQGEKKEKTTWHTIHCFGKISELAQKYIEVGSLIYVQGEIENNKIESPDKPPSWKYSLLANVIKVIPGVAKKTDNTTNGQRTNYSSNENQKNHKNIEFDDDMNY